MELELQYVQESYVGVLEPRPNEIVNNLLGALFLNHLRRRPSTL